MAQNPTTLAYQEEIKRLKAEIQALREQQTQLSQSASLLGSPNEAASLAAAGSSAMSQGESGKEIMVIVISGYYIRV